MTAIDAPLLILAGGRATRLGSATADTPKFLVPVGEQKFADLQLSWVKAQGFSEVVLSVGHLGDRIEAYVGDGARWGLRVRYAYDGRTLLGTGGAVKRALPQPAPFTGLLYGDTILDISCAEVMACAAQVKAHALMTVLRGPKTHACNAHFDGEKVAYAKARPRPEWNDVDYGFLVLSAEFVRALPDTTPLDLAGPLEEASAAGRLAGFLATRPFMEIGTPAALQVFRQRFGGSGP